MYHVFYTHTMSYVLVICRMFKIIYNIILYIILGIEEEEMQVVRGCVKKICYK
jgi:hypothetical protein